MTTRDTPTERARRIANHLLQLLPPDTRDRVVRQAHAVGETWLGPQRVIYTDDDIVAPGEAARLVYATPATLRRWVAAGVLVRQGGGGYRVGDVYTAHATIRSRRRGAPVQ